MNQTQKLGFFNKRKNSAMLKTILHYNSDLEEIHQHQQDTLAPKYDTVKVVNRSKN